MTERFRVFGCGFGLGTGFLGRQACGVTHSGSLREVMVYPRLTV